MRKSSHLGSVALFLHLLLAAASQSHADSIERRGVWLPRGDALAGALKTRPRRLIDWAKLPPEKRQLVALGAVLFRSPAVLGLEARRIGMSCETCHSGGHINAGFFLPGLSSRNGTVDLTSKAFHRPADDGRVNPLRIPSLRGVGKTAPYGHRGRFGSLEEFARHVIVDEFGGADPGPLVLQALAAFMAVLRQPSNRHLRRDGRLSRQASAAARRGERLFHKPGTGPLRRACASCHIPARAFSDGARHDVGSGGLINTPSLRGVAVGPYMHDGRFDLLGRTVVYFARRYGVANKPREMADLVAYLRIVGAASDATEKITLALDLRRVQAGEAVLEAVLVKRRGSLLPLVMPVLRRDLERIHDRFPNADHAAARAALIAWSREMQAVRSNAEKGDFETALQRLRTLRGESLRWRKTIRSAEATSLYDPVRLDGFLAERRRRKGL